MPVIAFLHTRSSYAPAVVAFQKALREAGFVEGQTVGIENRWAVGNRPDTKNAPPAGETDGAEWSLTSKQASAYRMRR